MKRLGVVPACSDHWYDFRGPDLVIEIRTASFWQFCLILL